MDTRVHHPQMSPPIGPTSTEPLYHILARVFLADTDAGYLARAMVKAREDWLGAKRSRANHPAIVGAVETFRMHRRPWSWARLRRAIASAGYAALIMDGVVYIASDRLPEIVTSDDPYRASGACFRSALILDLDS